MQAKLTQIGESLVFVIPREIQEQWGLCDSTPMEITTKGDVIILTRTRAASIDAVVAEADHQYGETFRRLAE